MHIENANNVERQKMFDPCKSKYNRKLQIGSDVNEANVQNISLRPNKILIENVASFKCTYFEKILVLSTSCPSDGCR